MVTREPTEEIKNSSNTSSDGTRRTDRVQISIPIEAYGTDLKRGRSFCQKGRTSLVSRHGAAIVLNYALATDQELTIRCLETNMEAEARVLGLISGPANDLVYGVALLKAEANPWGIEFPTLTGDEGFGRILLECRVCGIYKVVHLDEIEIQILEANQSIPQFCRSCSATTSWKKIPSEGFPQPPLPRDKQSHTLISQPHRVVNRRKHNRIQTNVPACIRAPRFPEEIVTCEDLSRGGLRFGTPKPHKKGARIEVAVPYSTGSGNIFVPARIVHVQDCRTFFRVGAGYGGAFGKQQRPDGYSGSSLLPDLA
jgi:hypothetical protein